MGLDLLLYKFGEIKMLNGKQSLIVRPPNFDEIGHSQT